MVYVIPQNHGELQRYPSPEALRKRIVIKGDGKLESIHPVIEKGNNKGPDLEE